MMQRRIGMYVGMCLWCLAWGQASGEGRTATLYRDTWGVPHVYAETLADAAYALGYAQAEDRLDDIYLNVRTAVGRLAEVLGPDVAERDYVMRLVGNADRCEAYWKTAPPHLKDLGDGFMRGVEAYLADHPGRRSPFALDLAGWQCLAIQRAMILQWPVGQVMDELRNKKSAPPFGSNSFAVAPARSADGSAILMTDPHLTWEGMAVFYEARVHAGEDRLCGYWLVGSPMPALGHTGHVAWACTTGGPDTSDVYMVRLNPENPLQYEYEGAWRDFDVKSFSIDVKGAGSVEKTALYSVHGPVVEEPDRDKGIAYCGASPYFESMDLLDQVYRMVKARNVDEFYRALAMNQLMEQNVSFADREGHIRYVRNGAVPIRPEGYDWRAPVPGGTEATRWLGIHPIDDLVQVADPPQGYFQNSNNSPESMMADSPMTPGKHRDYIYNVTWDRYTPRGARLLQLLDADDSITREEALEYTLDVYDLLAKPWQAALEAALRAPGVTRPSGDAFDRAVEDILAWDGRFAVDSVAAPVIRFWRLKCQDALPILDIAEGRALSDADASTLLALLAEALDDLQARYGRLGMAWGDINLIGRGGRYFPSPGAEFGRGNQRTYTETVMDVGTRELPDGTGRYVGYDGSSSVLVSFLYPDRIESFSLVNWGQSADPESPHYVDQAEKLYSHRRFKPTWMEKEDLLQNLESEKVLPIAAR